MPVALVTGASRGLGRALTNGLVDRGWVVVVDARTAADLDVVSGPHVIAVPGDVADPAHRQRLVEVARGVGGIDLLVNNASVLGPSPQPHLADYPLAELRRVYEVNAVAPLALIQAALPELRRSPHGRIVNITSDAAVEAYDGWGGYGSSKAALDHLSAVLAAEEPGVRVWAVDPGDLRTRLHQQAFPGEDISDRPEPETVVPAFLALIASDRPSGRIRLPEIRTTEVVPA